MSVPSSSVPPGAPVVPRPAAAVVLMRDRAAGGVEILMVRRHVRSDFAPDVFVFPGGSVNPGDREAEATTGLCIPAGDGVTGLGSGFRVAALRELFEEAGVLLAYRRDTPLTLDARAVERFATHRGELCAGRTTMGSIAAREGLRLATDQLIHWAHWITPEAMPKRFDTHFFLAGAPAGQTAIHDQQEVTDSLWIAPEEALERFDRREFPLVFATVRQLRELASLTDTLSARLRFTGPTPRTIMPVATRTPDGGFMVQIADSGDPPERF
jgi:8-oxo-dGTP pyrophosphatase MutT (NUDIX family)